MNQITAALAAFCVVGASFVSAATFNQADDNETGNYGYYYAVGGGLPQNGQTINGSNGAIAFITDSPYWTSADSLNYDQWYKDSWYPSTTSLALTMKDGGNIVYDNNGIESNTVPANYWDGESSDPSVSGSGVVGYSMSNNYDWIYAGLFQLNAATEVDQITGFFLVSTDPNSPADGFDPNAPELKFNANIFSQTAGGLPTNTGSFDGDTFSSNTTPGIFSWADTGYQRIGSGGSVSDIYSLTYTLDAPITLGAGSYYFSTDASIVPLPSAAWGGLALLGLVARLARKRNRQIA